jgi:hypothetical protein
MEKIAELKEKIKNIEKGLKEYWEKAEREEFDKKSINELLNSYEETIKLYNYLFTKERKEHL